MMGRIDADFKKRFKEIHKGAADIVADEARRQAPVRSGRLRKDIRTSGTAKGGVVRVGRKKIPYVGRVLFGDPITFRDRLMRRAQTRRTPQPFIYKAADIQFRNVVDYYNDELEEILDDAIEAANRGR
tara:strand:- start:748 stop:1131 length:384 start_codon:yes stop_codon:yes gene_type:complete